MSVAGVVRIVKRPVAGSRLPSRAPITLSQAAISRLHTLMPKEKPLAGVRLGVKTRGCSGLSYTLDWAEKKEKNDEVVEAEGVKIFVDPRALLHVVGTEMDYVDNDIQSGFVFNNPSAKSTCGCGESFTP